jgi:hypothetical protein
VCHGCMYISSSVDGVAEREREQSRGGEQSKLIKQHTKVLGPERRCVMLMINSSCSCSSSSSTV